MFPNRNEYSQVAALWLFLKSQKTDHQSRFLPAGAGQTVALLSSGIDRGFEYRQQEGRKCEFVFPNII